MTVLRHPALQWGLPLAALIAIFWLSLFCYSAIPVSGVEAIRALLPGHTPTLPQALVQNLRLPRSLVAILIGAGLALAGTLLQTLTHNSMASPSLLGINSGAALAMALTSAISPVPVSGYSISFIAACGGGVSWLLVMTAGGGFRHTQDRNKLILAGIAFSAFCMALTRITLLLTEDHAYGIFYWLAGGVSHARWQEFWQLFPVVAVAVPVVLLLANQLNLLNVSDSTARTLGVNLPKAAFDHQYSGAASGRYLRQCGWPGGVHRPADAASGSLLGGIRPAQGSADEHTDGCHADATGGCSGPRAGLPW
jgi:ABC-type Fe3+-siderophore transport system, permease component